MRTIVVVTRGPLNHGARHTITADLETLTLSVDHPWEVEELRGRTVIQVLLDDVTESELWRRLPAHQKALDRATRSTNAPYTELYTRPAPILGADLDRWNTGGFGDVV